LARDLKADRELHVATLAALKAQHEQELVERKQAHELELEKLSDKLRFSQSDECRQLQAQIERLQQNADRQRNECEASSLLKDQQLAEQHEKQEATVKDLKAELEANVAALAALETRHEQQLAERKQTYELELKQVLHSTSQKSQKVVAAESLVKERDCRAECERLKNELRKRTRNGWWRSVLWVVMQLVIFLWNWTDIGMGQGFSGNVTEVYGSLGKDLGALGDPVWTLTKPFSATSLPSRAGSVVEVGIHPGQVSAGNTAVPSASLANTDSTKAVVPSASARFEEETEDSKKKEGEKNEKEKEAVKAKTMEQAEENREEKDKDKDKDKEEEDEAVNAEAVNAEAAEHADEEQEKEEKGKAGAMKHAEAKQDTEERAVKAETIEHTEEKTDEGEKEKEEHKGFEVKEQEKQEEDDTMTVVISESEKELGAPAEMGVSATLAPSSNTTSAAGNIPSWAAGAGEVGTAGGALGATVGDVATSTGSAAGTASARSALGAAAAATRRSLATVRERLAAPLARIAKPLPVLAATTACLGSFLGLLA